MNTKQQFLLGLLVSTATIFGFAAQDIDYDELVSYESISENDLDGQDSIQTSSGTEIEPAKPVQPGIKLEEESDYLSLALYTYRLKKNPNDATLKSTIDQLIAHYTKENKLTQIYRYNASYAQKMITVVQESTTHVYTTGFMQRLDHRQEQSEQSLTQAFTMLADAIIWEEIAQEFLEKAVQIPSHVHTPKQVLPLPEPVAHNANTLQVDLPADE